MIGYIIPLIILIIAAVIIFKITKTVIKTVILTIAIFLVMLIIAGFVLVADIRDFQENFPTKQNIYLFEYPEGHIATGVKGKFSQDLHESMNLIDEETLKNYRDDYSKSNLDSILGNSYKIMIVKEDLFEEMETVSFFDGGELTKEEFFDIMSSEKPIDLFIDNIVPYPVHRDSFRQQVMEEFDISSDSEFKGMIFMIGFFSLVEEKGGFFLLNNIRQGNVNVYPKTLLIDMIGILPSESIGQIIPRGEEKSD